MYTSIQYQEDWTHFLNCLDLNTSPLDNKAITFMNYAPGEIIRALEQVERITQICSSPQTVFDECTLDKVERETLHQPETR